MAFIAAVVLEALVELGEAASFAELSLQTTAVLDVGLSVVSAQILVPVVTYMHHTRGRSTAEASDDFHFGHSGMDVDTHYVFETPCATPDTAMGGVPTKRAVTPIETPKPKRVYESPDPRDHKHTVVRQVKHTGPSYTAGWCRDFSGIQRTRVNPVTGRIIGYKGIRRKRALSPTSKYSSFWREQKYAKPSLHAARSPGIWDSARR